MIRKEKYFLGDDHIFAQFDGAEDIHSRSWNIAAKRELFRESRMQEMLREWQKTGDRQLKMVIDKILANNQNLKKEIFTLREQLAAFERTQTLAAGDLETMILPGKILQDDDLVDWPYLRREHGLVFDEPLGHYHFGVSQVLEKRIGTTNGNAYAIKQLIAKSRHDFAKENELDESDVSIIEEKLHRCGICFGLPENKLMTRFYYCYFANINLAAIGISGRLFSLMCKENLNTVGDLLVCNVNQFRQVRSFGPSSYGEIYKLLSAMGFRLDMHEADFKKLYRV